MSERQAFGIACGEESTAGTGTDVYGVEKARVSQYYYEEFLDLRNLQGSTDHTLRNTALCYIASSTGKRPKCMKLEENFKTKMAANQLQLSYHLPAQAKEDAPPPWEVSELEEGTQRPFVGGRDWNTICQMNGPC